MKVIDIIKSANSNLWRSKSRSLLTILAVFIGSFTIVLTAGINTGVNTYINKQMDSAGGDGYLEIMPSGMMDMFTDGMIGSTEVKEYNPNKNSSATRTLTDEDIQKIRSIDGIKSAETYSQVEVEYASSDKNDKKFAMSVAEMPSSTINVDMSTGRIVDVKSETPEIALVPNYAQAFGYDDNSIIGQTITLSVKNSLTSQLSQIEATVSGVQNASIISMGRSWINNALQTKLYDAIMAGLPAQYTSQAYFATAEFDTTLTKDQVQDIKNQLQDMGLRGMAIEDEVGMIKSFFDAITIVLIIFGVIALIAASIGIINTLFMAVQERTREIGLMKAMGLSKIKIRLMFSLEAMALGFWGSVIGIAVGFVAGNIANSISKETFLASLPGFNLVEFDWFSMVAIVMLVMFIAFLAGTLPARRASKLNPIDALRYE
jgi:putative ABC transport system permease protein